MIHNTFKTSIQGVETEFFIKPLNHMKMTHLSAFELYTNCIGGFECCFIRFKKKIQYLLFRLFFPYSRMKHEGMPFLLLFTQNLLSFSDSEKYG